tara:strand:+ start:62 stop:304 length:243 start_codon:yes stop_codon:yes gene_type:complete
LALDEFAKSMMREITVLSLISANGLFGKRVEPALAGTMITKESVIQGKNSFLNHSWDIVFNWITDIAQRALQMTLFINQF